MRTTIFALMALGAVSGMAMDFSEEASRVESRIVARIELECGLQRLWAFDPKLPRPRVPADHAYVIKGTRRVVAFDREDNRSSDHGIFGWFQTNGRFVGGFHNGEDYIGFQLPSAPGMQASISRYYTINGVFLRHVCLNQPISPKVFWRCLEVRFETPVVKAVCDLTKGLR